jgi:hypothetical protein
MLRQVGAIGIVLTQARLALLVFVWLPWRLNDTGRGTTQQQHQYQQHDTQRRRQINLLFGARRTRGRSLHICLKRERERESSR